MSDEGWIPYDGSGMPCDGNTVVSVKFRDGVYSSIPDRAKMLLWTHLDYHGDITHYRPHRTADEQKTTYTFAKGDEYILKSATPAIAGFDLGGPDRTAAQQVVPSGRKALGYIPVAVGFILAAMGLVQPEPNIPLSLLCAFVAGIYFGLLLNQILPHDTNKPTVISRVQSGESRT